VKSFLNALVRALVRPPFGDESGGKGWFDRFTRASPHVVRQIRLTIPGWPCWSRSLRIAFISDFHTGSHAHDVARLRGIIADVTAFRPDLVLYGGDFVNMQLFGGGRVPPSTIASILGELRAPLGAFAVLSTTNGISFHLKTRPSISLACPTLMLGDRERRHCWHLCRSVDQPLFWSMIPPVSQTWPKVLT
jgi:hypothetical protein